MTDRPRAAAGPRPTDRAPVGFGTRTVWSPASAPAPCALTPIVSLSRRPQSPGTEIRLARKDSHV